MTDDTVKRLAEKIFDIVGEYVVMAPEKEEDWDAMAQRTESILSEAMEDAFQAEGRKIVPCTRCDGLRRPVVMPQSRLCSYCYDVWLAGEKGYNDGLKAANKVASCDDCERQAYSRAAEVARSYKTHCYTCERDAEEIAAAIEKLKDA